VKPSSDGPQPSRTQPAAKCVIASVSYTGNTLTCSCGWAGTADEAAYQVHRIAMGNRRGISSHLVKPPKS
jgi:hypothetical protein